MGRDSTESATENENKENCEWKESSKDVLHLTETHRTPYILHIVGANWYAMILLTLPTELSGLVEKPTHAHVLFCSIGRYK